MDVPAYSFTVKIGGSGHSWDFNAFPRQLYVGQSFTLDGTVTDENDVAFALDGATATMTISGYNNSQIATTTLDTTVIGTGNTFTMNCPIDAIPAALAGLEDNRQGSAVLTIVIEEAAVSKIVIRERVTVFDVDHTLEGDSQVSIPADLATYTPATPADWDVVPSTVAPALDEMAARQQAQEAGVTDFITVTQAVDLDTMESDTATNNAKVTNATHTGEVTGSGALTVAPLAITNKTTVTAASGDFVLLSDTSDSGNLKKVDAADFLTFLPVADTTSIVKGSVDPTKELRFEVDGLTTATTRTITMPDNDVDLADIATNNAKVTNATHTGDVTGSGALTLESVAITGQTTVTPVSGDFVLLSDTSDSGNLKKVDAVDFLAGAGDMLAATYDPATISEQLVGLTATQTLTNKTVNGVVLSDAGAATDYLDETGNYSKPTVTGAYRNIYIDAAAMVPRTTNGAEALTKEFATNDIMIDYLAFDSTTEEGAQFKFMMPDEWDRGTIKVKFFWDAAATASGTCVWGIKAGALSNDDPIDAALGTEVSVTDTLLAVGDMHVSPATAAVTVGGTPALEDMIVMQVVAKTTGTIAVDQFLMGVAIQYKELTTEPAAW